MPSKILPMVCLLLLIGCSKEQKLHFNTVTLGDEECETCTTVQITIPQAEGNSKIASAVNMDIREEVISFLIFDDTIETGTIEEAIASFHNGYEELREKFSEETSPWKGAIEGKITYEDPRLLSIKLEAYLFTGGAHGFTSTRFLNFDKEKGVALENNELFISPTDFTQFAEMKFREQEKIPPEAPINSTGFMFETEEFYLPDNIGFTVNGLQLFYEQYEIASYADGPIVIDLPFEEVKPYLRITPLQ